VPSDKTTVLVFIFLTFISTFSSFYSISGSKGKCPIDFKMVYKLFKTYPEPSEYVPII